MDSPCKTMSSSQHRATLVTTTCNHEMFGVHSIVVGSVMTIPAGMSMIST